MKDPRKNVHDHTTAERIAKNTETETPRYAEEPTAEEWKQHAINERRAALTGQRFTASFYGAWFVLDELSEEAVPAESLEQAVELAEERNEYENAPATADEIIAMLNREVKKLQGFKVMAKRESDAWLRANAKQAELHYILGRLTAHKFGIRSITEEADAEAAAAEDAAVALAEQRAGA